MPTRMNDTRAILHTPPGAGGIGVVLLTGPATREILATLFRPRPAGRGDSTTGGGGDRLILGELHDHGLRLDEAIVSVRAGGEWAEINIHGGPRVTQRLLKRLAEAGAKMASAPSGDAWPMAAEGLGNPAIGRELVEAMQAARTRSAVARLTWQWSAGVSELARLALANPEDQSIAPALRAAAERWLQMRRYLNPPEIVLAGPPNAGKSSLANALLGRSACIVSDVPGTTRDWVRELADLAGLPAWLVDTAGLWSPVDELDVQAVARAWARVESADLVLAVCDAANPPTDSATWSRLTRQLNAILVANKTDLAAAPVGYVCVSALTRAGLPALHAEILRRLGLHDFPIDQPAAFTARQAELLIAAGMAEDRAPILRELLEG